jgi:hypothetical protein
MLNETPTLIEPTLILKADFCSLAEEFLAEGDQRYREAIADFEGFIQLCSDEAVGRNLAPGRSTTEHILASPRRTKDPRAFSISAYSKRIS